MKKTKLGFQLLLKIFRQDKWLVRMGVLGLLLVYFGLFGLFKP